MKTGARGEGRTATYEIRVAGHLGAEWVEWFDGLAITQEPGGDTLLTGSVADQSALYGLLRKVRDLGLTLLAVNLIAEDRSDSPAHPSHTHHKEESQE
jgi:hypothetical protein